MPVNIKPSIESIVRIAEKRNAGINIITKTANISSRNIKLISEIIQFTKKTISTIKRICAKAILLYALFSER